MAQQVGATRSKQLLVGFDEEPDASEIDWQPGSEQELGWWPQALDWQPLGGPTVASRAEYAPSRAGGGKPGGKGEAGRREGKGSRGAAALTPYLPRWFG